MKRIFILLLVVVFAIVTVSCSAEEFTIHNGVSFGMKKEEVIERESNAGVSFEEATNWSNFFDNDVFRIESESTSVAGRDDSMIAYLFDSAGSMNSTLYIADDFLKESIENDRVVATLIDKYGKPVAEKDGIVNIGGEAYDSLDVYMNYTKQHPKDNPNITLFYQWLYPLDEGYADIQIMMISLSVINYRIISYSYRTESEMQKIRDKIDSETQGMLNDL